MRLQIPLEFIHDRTHMSWREIHFGLRNELLDPLAPVELSLKQVAELAYPAASLLALAELKKNKPTLWLVEQLADDEPKGPEAKILSKWLYLVLAWIYDHLSEYPEPLQKVEEVYADFGYPMQMANFVRYMPMEGPDLGSREANEERLFRRWKVYIEKAASKYAPQQGSR